MTASETLTIGPEFFGFEGIGHGGYTSGLLAEHLPGSLEVKILQPPPLDTPMQLSTEDGQLTLTHADLVIARARRKALSMGVPPAPSLALAGQSMAFNRDLVEHPSPTCMTCGPQRDLGQGLRVFVGPSDDGELVAGSWVPHPNFADAEGNVRTPFVWAALDCPTYWAIRAGYGQQGRMVTGRLTVQTIAPVPTGSPCIVLGWPDQRKGGRLFVSGAAIVTPEGEPLAVAEAVWMSA